MSKTELIHNSQLHDGFLLLVNKPKDWSSFDVVKKVRNCISGKIKVGHSGTLDPMATGLLQICTGKWTKRLTEFSGLDKSYSATMTLGGSTPSYDAETEVENPVSYDHINLALLEETKTAFLGTIQQAAPIYSALKVNGKRQADLVRKGVKVEPKIREVQIQRIEVQECSLPEVRFQVDCGKGTYIRSLAHDWGKALNSAAYLSALVRDRIGDSKLEDAWDLDALVAHIQNLPKE